jgi:hypothetical protein
MATKYIKIGRWLKSVGSTFLFAFISVLNMIFGKGEGQEVIIKYYHDINSPKTTISA